MSNGHKCLTIYAVNVYTSSRMAAFLVGEAIRSACAEERDHQNLMTFHPNMYSQSTMICTFDCVLAVRVPCGLPIVKGDLLPPLDLPLGEEAEAGHVGVEAINVHVENVQVGITAAR